MRSQPAGLPTSSLEMFSLNFRERSVTVTVDAAGHYPPPPSRSAGAPRTPAAGIVPGGFAISLGAKPYYSITQVPLHMATIPI